MEHPNNGYALLGVSRALSALGRDADAAQLAGVHEVTYSCTSRDFELGFELYFLKSIAV